MEATVAERGQITLPKAVRDALGLTKGTTLKVELDGGRIILRKNVNDALREARGKFKLVDGCRPPTTPCAPSRGRAPGDPRSTHDRRRLLRPDRPAGRRPAGRRRRKPACAMRWRAGRVVVCDVVVAEVQRAARRLRSLMDALDEMGIRYQPRWKPSAMRAGRHATGASARAAARASARSPIS